ncbi:hypothetical protein [Fusobacterium necrophorum]|uniref:Antitoxin VbhA domain-containing protein n=2 Tax=Fusobacterium necrophorum TaxID=859 RepID=A0AB73BTE7_9FUSO|nr:hypothetical protein [Fusobacterium necrophorum]KDE60967.1 hypothetical protein FUSO3_11440 [Fusobacterium necrophorum BL]KDE66148.1 hypothetical protein FUSO4_05145 [Fusobacterium necrophorum DJ-1]KDE68669.1 hypothetical protein FUSO6_08140 [Fusobacterium necrophorum DAB]KDE69004.1 hypothetical protein FUSO7_12315 [Fusobacterium necrophorum BFTR-2]KDE72255.1 hypothetical protein FUSO8_05890 [Fusobacterium necrophorum DJ-2]
MIDRTKLSPIIRETIVVTEAECGKMSEEDIEYLIKNEKGEISYQEILKTLKDKYGVK